MNDNTVIQMMKRNIYGILPGIVTIVSFGASVLAPGNKVRMSSSTGFGAIKSVLVSFYYFLTDPFEKWISWPIIISLALAIPFMWQIVKKVEYSFKYPGIVAVLGFCFVSAAYTPSLYAQGGAGAGRQDNTVFLIWIIVLYVVVFYIVGWLNKYYTTYSKEKYLVLNKTMKIYILGVAFFWLLASGLTVMIDEDTYIGTYAGYAIMSGQAQTYREENEQRLELLKSDEKNVVLQNFSNPPELLVFQDISTDASDWLNRAMAEYYEKESVRREE